MCSSPSILLADGNPLDARGPEFLALFLVLLMAAIVVGILFRRMVRGSASAASSADLDLHPYEVAYLVGGAGRTADTVLARLAHEEVIRPTGQAIVLQGKSLSEDAHLLERAALGEQPAGEGQALEQAGTRVAAATGTLHGKLTDSNLILSSSARLLARLVPAGLLLALLVFGILKVQVGVERKKPVTFLVLLCIGTGIGVVIWLLKSLHRTRKGDAVVAELSRDKAALRETARVQSQTLNGHDLSLAVALFGTALFTTGTVANLHTSLKAAKQGGDSGEDGGTWWFFHSSSGGCGGASASTCGGGGGDAGGGGGCGGGGGGCGGCGGGGGD